MLRSQSDIPLLVVALMIPAQRFASGLRPLTLENALRKAPLDGLDTLLGCTLTLVGNDPDRKPGGPQRRFVTGSIDLLRSCSVVRQDAVRRPVPLLAQPVDVKAELLTHCLVVIDDPDLAPHELDDPDRGGVGLHAGAADVPVGPDAEQWIYGEET